MYFPFNQYQDGDIIRVHISNGLVLEGKVSFDTPTPEWIILEKDYKTMYIRTSEIVTTYLIQRDEYMSMAEE